MTRCGSLGFNATSQYSEANREKFGANAAEIGLANAILKESQTLQWEVWSSEVFSSLTKTHESRSQEPELGDLKRKYGDRIQVRRLTALQEIATDPRYVFLANASTFSRISDLRSQIGAARMPICALTHSLYTRELLSGFSWILLSSEPHDVIVASSDAGRRTLENWFAAAADRISAKIPGANSQLTCPRIVKIPFGTDIPREDNLDQQRARSLLNLPTDSFVMLYFGRITEEYKADLDPLLQAVQHLETSGHNPSLVLAGQIADRAYLAHLERRLTTLGLRDKTVLIENCPEFLKTAVYAACDVVVSPADSIQETFGLSILEAMAHARPVVCSDWSGYRELVEDGVTGFLIRTIWTSEASRVASLMSPTTSPLAVAHYLAQRTIVDCEELTDKLTMLADKPELRTEMGKAGRLRVEQDYGWKQVASRFLELWEDQFERARYVERKPADITLNKFLHYATGTVRPTDLLARMAGTGDVEASMLNSFHFYSEAARAQVHTLLEITSIHPISVGDLRHEGFELDSILWLAKKGLRHIVSMPDALG